MNLLQQAAPLLFWGWIVLMAIFAALWMRQLRTRNATSVDAAWSSTIGLLGMIAAILATGSAPQRILAAVVIGLWSLRLSWHLVADRILSDTAEDGRYRALRQLLGTREALGFFFVYQLQALLALGFAAPFVLQAYADTQTISSLQIVGVAVAVASQLLESVADRQLATHRADPALRTLACRRGLWRYSRHPNYFFEWLTWCGFAIMHAEVLGWGAAIALATATGMRAFWFRGDRISVVVRIDAQAAGIGRLVVVLEHVEGDEDAWLAARATDRRGDARARIGAGGRPQAAGPPCGRRASSSGTRRGRRTRRAWTTRSSRPR